MTALRPRSGERFTDGEGRAWCVTAESARGRAVAELRTGKRPGSAITDEFGRRWEPLNLSPVTGRAKVALEPDRTVCAVRVLKPLLYGGYERQPGEVLRVERWTLDVDRLVGDGVVERSAQA